MNKKSIINSLVGLFFLYVVYVLDKERLMYKKRCAHILNETSANPQEHFKFGWQEGYKKGYETAIEDINRSLDSLTAQEHDQATDDTTRYS